MLWLERSKLAEMAPQLRVDSELSLDTLEHLSIMPMDDMLVATYFLRSFDHPQKQLILRTTVSAGADAAIPSVRGTWKMAAPIEDELSERFGIRFTRDERTAVAAQEASPADVSAGDIPTPSADLDGIFPTESSTTQ